MKTVIQNTIAPSIAEKSYLNNKFEISKNENEAVAEAALTYMQNGLFSGIDESNGTHLIASQDGTTGQRLHFIA